jgi:predicted kinase
MAVEEGAKTVIKTHAGQLGDCGLLPSTGNRYSYTKHLVWLWVPLNACQGISPQDSAAGAYN